MKVLQWRKNEIELQLQRALLVSRQQHDSEEVERSAMKDSEVEERAQWMHAIIQDELEKPLEVTKVGFAIGWDENRAANLGLRWCVRGCSVRRVRHRCGFEEVACVWMQGDVLEQEASDARLQSQWRRQVREQKRLLRAVRKQLLERTGGSAGGAGAGAGAAVATAHSTRLSSSASAFGDTDGSGSAGDAVPQEVTDPLARLSLLEQQIKERGKRRTAQTEAAALLTRFSPTRPKTAL